MANQLYKHCHWSSQGSKMAHLLVVVAWIFYGAKNLSLCIRTLAQSSGWNTTCLRLLLALVAYIHTVPLFNLLLHTLMKCLTTCALQLPSKLTLIQAKKSNPYTILNGGNPIVECTLWLYSSFTSLLLSLSISTSVSILFFFFIVFRPLFLVLPRSRCRRSCVMLGSVAYLSGLPRFPLFLLVLLSPIPPCVFLFVRLSVFARCSGFLLCLLRFPYCLSVFLVSSCAWVSSSFCIPCSCFYLWKSLLCFFAPLFVSMFFFVPVSLPPGFFVSIVVLFLLYVFHLFFLWSPPFSSPYCIRIYRQENALAPLKVVIVQPLR